MTAQKSWRKRVASVLATATAALVVASGLALAPTAAFADEPAVTGTATVSSATETGITVDVAVAGIAAPATTYPNGIHIGVVTRGTAEGALEANFVGATASIGRAGSMPAAGTAAASVAVPVADLDRNVEYEVVVWPQRSNPTAANILKVIEFDVTETQWDAVFPVVVPAASLTAAVTEATGAGLKLTAAIDGIVLRAADQGAYVAVIEKSRVSELGTGADAAVVADFAYKAVITNGAVTRSIVAPAAKLDRTKQYAVVSWLAHGNLDDERFIAQADLTVTEAQWNAVFPAAEPEPNATTLKTTVTKASTAGLEIKAELKNIVSANGAYVSLIEAGTSATLTQENMGIGVDWVTQNRFTNGSATATMTVSAEDLDRTKSYEVISWRGHTLPTVGTIFNVAPLSVTAAQWDAVFAKPAVKIPFTDIKKGDKFYKEIAWMYTAKVTTGVKQADGTVKYQPKANVTREAMAAFLFRQYGESDYKAPKTSPFSDIKTTDKFYKEIAWMKSKGISTGTKQASGLPKYDAKTSVTREAMSAFLYRIDKGSKPNAPKVSPFSDVKTTDKFFKEISWMSSTGISTGIKQSSGKPAYAPKNSVTREAMAAFLFRVDAK